jgi:general stress protein 26
MEQDHKAYVEVEGTAPIKNSDDKKKLWNDEIKNPVLTDRMTQTMWF